MDYVQAITAILTGIATAIPFIVALVKFVRMAAKEKNWSKVMKVVLNLMENAELECSNGKDRKDYVMSSIDTATQSIDYEIDKQTISDMIDAICAVAKNVNRSK